MAENRQRSSDRRIMALQYSDPVTAQFLYNTCVLFDAISISLSAGRQADALHHRPDQPGPAHAQALGRALRDYRLRAWFWGTARDSCGQRPAAPSFDRVGRFQSRSIFPNESD